MKKSDFIIIILALVLIAGVYLFSEKFNEDKSANELAICLDGEIIDRLPIYEDRVYEFKGENGDKNTVKIKAGKVEIIEANCENQVCVHSHPISKAGETIVCLPHRFYVEILGKKEGEIDAVAD